MRVTVLSTGGTIASTGGENGAEPTKAGEELVSAVPELGERAEVTVEQVAQVPSFEMDAATLERIGDRVRELDEGEGANRGTDAVVITHGTDTMEETAYYLDAAVGPDLPVFLTGAQRRPDQHSPDGPANLLAAFDAAATFVDRDDGGAGVFVAFDDEVHAARRVTKAHTSRLGAFRSVPAGPVATLGPDGVAVHRTPESESAALPASSLDAGVYTVKSGSGVTGDLLVAAVERGADGVVVEGTGLGNATAGIGEAVRDAVEAGIPVVVTSRCLGGRTAPVYGGEGGGERLREHGAVHAGDLPAQKARLKLALAIAAYDDPEAVRRAVAG